MATGSPSAPGGTSISSARIQADSSSCWVTPTIIRRYRPPVPHSVSRGPVARAGHRPRWKHGRSTAPHLHFEVRQKGVSLDPRTMVKEGS